MTHATALQNHRLMLGGRSFLPLMLGGMGTNTSTAELALAVERLGGIAHLSDAMLMDLSDRLFGTRFTAEKAKRTASERDNMDKSAVTFNLDNVKEAARRYVSDVMSRATGHGLVLINCMEKLTMNAGLETLRARLTAALDGGIDGITLSAGLHLSSMKLMADHPRFKDALIGIIVSSSRALNLFLKKSASTGRLPDYVVVEGPLAGGHLGFGMDWANYSLADIVKDVKAFLAKSSLNIPVIAAGGIFTGGEAAEMMSDTGCDGIQAATRFAVAQESGLPYAVKQAYFNAKPEDIVVNHLSPTGYPMRMLRQSPAITGDIRPNCEAYGYLLNHGDCSYLKEWRLRQEAAANGTPASEMPAKEKCCLCTYMRNYKVWTCGTSAARLHETSVRQANGEWILPTAADVFHDYMQSTGSEILLPEAAREYLAQSRIPEMIASGAQLLSGVNRTVAAF